MHQPPPPPQNYAQPPPPQSSANPFLSGAPQPPFQQQPPPDESQMQQHQQVVNAALTNPFGPIQQNAENFHAAGVSPAVVTPDPPSYPAPPSDQSTPNPSPVPPFTHQQSAGSEVIGIPQQQGQTLGIYEQTPFSKFVTHSIEYENKFQILAGNDSSYTSPSHFHQQMQQQQPQPPPPQGPPRPPPPGLNLGV